MVTLPLPVTTEVKRQLFAHPTLQEELEWGSPLLQKSKKNQQQKPNDSFEWSSWETPLVVFETKSWKSSGELIPLNLTLILHWYIKMRVMGSWVFSLSGQR